MNRNILLDLASEHIKTFPAVLPLYSYEHEESINPVYCDIEHCLPLCFGEKRIWVLRSDLTLAVGIKNAYTVKGNTSLLDKTDETMHKYINPKDRYGHPSLAQPENGYDGSVHYAGWIHKHSNRIEVYICSGRYHNKKLSDEQKLFLESYILLKLIDAYGEQKIMFRDWINADEFESFLQGKSYPSIPSPRIYSKYDAKITCAVELLRCSSINGSQKLLLLHLIQEKIISILTEGFGLFIHWAIVGMLDYFVSRLIARAIVQIPANEDHPAQKSITCKTTRPSSLESNLTQVSLFKPGMHSESDDMDITYKSKVS